MATLNQFESLIGEVVRIRANGMGPTKKRTRERIQQKGGSDGSFVVVKVSGGINTPAIAGRKCVQFESVDGKWWGWLPLEEIEIAP